jgi:hypothetical protein
MRILLTNYLRNENVPADINRLEGGPIASSRIWFDEWTGVEASSLGDTLIEQLRPHVYRCMALEEEETLYMKVHDAWKRTDRGEGLFPAEITAGVIYIIRNPLDMAKSCAHHWGVPLEQAVENLCNPHYSLSRTVGGISDQLQQYLGSWSNHVTSWIDDSGLPVHVVRYEDLLYDTVDFFSKVVRYCGLPYDLDRIQKAVAFSDFSELQRQEKVNSFQETPPKALGAFFRRGQAGSWRDELPVKLAKLLISTHGETMHRFGYL